MINRPVREKPAQQVVEEVLRGLQGTGMEEVSLISLSTTDTRRSWTGERARGPCQPDARAALLPSTRPDNVPQEVAQRIAAQKKGSITPRARGGQPACMRDVINKNHTEAELLQSVRTAATEGYTGRSSTSCADFPVRTTTTSAPSSTSATRPGRRRARRGTSRSRHHRERFPSRAEAAHAVRVGGAGEHRRAQSPSRRAARGGQGSASRSRSAVPRRGDQLSKAFTRGDRRLCAVVGTRIAAAAGSTPGPSTQLRDLARRFSRPRTRTRTLPGRAFDGSRSAGDMVQSPVTRKFLVREKPGADRAAVTDDCRLEDICFSCGVVDCNQRPWVREPHASLDLDQAVASVPTQAFGRKGRRTNATAGGVGTSLRFRIQYEKGKRDALPPRTWTSCASGSACSTLRLPLAFSQGHHPHIKMSPGPRRRWAIVRGPRCSTSSSRGRPVSISPKGSTPCCRTDPDRIVPAHSVQGSFCS